jgi:hypothetical protein
MKTATYFSDGAAERTRTRKCQFEEVVGISGEFSLVHRACWDQRLFLPEVF